MTPDSSKGPACNCAPCRHEAAERTAPIPYLRRHVAEAIYDALKIYNRADVDVAADAIVAMVRPELERLTAELQAQNRLYRMVGSERDEKQFEVERLRRWVDRFRERAAEHLAEVSRLREQLAAQPKVPVDADEFVSVALNAAANRCNAALSEGLDISLTGAVMDLLRSWGVSSSEVEASRPPRHEVRMHPCADRFHAKCQTCGEFRCGDQAQAEDWKDQHEADTLRPVLTNESFISSQDEGRPSGSERLAPQSVDEFVVRLRGLVFDLRDKPLESDHIDYDTGWRDGQIQAGNDLEMLLDEYAPDAAQAARSEATPEALPAVDPDAFGAAGYVLQPPSPSLPKEGEDTPPVARRAVYAHPGYDYEYGEEGERVGINAGWDLAFGCRVSFGLDEGESYVVVSMSDRELRDGSCNRSVTREQIRGFAYYLIQMTEEMDEFLPSVSSQVEKEGETDEQ